MKFNDKLRLLRRESNATLKEVSNGIGIPLSTYSNYEQGRREPSLEVLKLICDFYNVSADYLIGRTDNY